jgi:cation transport regulator
MLTERGNLTDKIFSINPSYIDRSGFMTYEKRDELPEEIREQLPEHAQQIFMAAFNAAQTDGMSEEGASNVAWNSVRNEYEQGSDRQWHRKPEDPAIHNKAVMSGGN